MTDDGVGSSASIGLPLESKRTILTEGIDSTSESSLDAGTRPATLIDGLFKKP